MGSETYDLDAEIDALIREHPEKAKQAREKPSLQGWFAGRLMKDWGGCGDYGGICQRVASRLSSPPGELT